MELKIASIQLDIVWQNTEKNLQMLKEYVIQSAAMGCNVVVLPELFHAGFSMDVERIAQSKNQVVYQTLSELSEQYGLYIIGGTAQKSNGSKALNSALVFNRRGLEIACYIKNHTFNYADEGAYYQAGNHSVIFELDGIPCSVFICYDLRFPELLRQVARDVEVIFVIANWPESRQQHWEVLLQARAIENQCFLVGVNRVGQDGNGLNYLGGSMVVDPLGEVLSYGKTAEPLIVTELQTEKVAELRHRFPFLKDMKSF